MRTFSSVVSLLPLAFAGPLSVRQGGAFVSVGNKYSGPGCVPSTLIFADPVFGNGNVCQPLNRQADAVPVLSYETLSVCAGGSVSLFTGVNCTGTAYLAPVGGCVTDDAPFESVFVTCPE